MNIIGEQGEPPSDKLGGEIFISSYALVCLSIYIYMVSYGLTTNTMPTRIVCIHSQLKAGSCSLIATRYHYFSDASLRVDQIE